MSFATPTNFTKNPDGFVPPKFGGSLAVMTGTVDFEDTTAIELFTLPAGAVMVDFYVNVTTNFDDTGTDTIDVGTSATGDAIIDGLDVSSAGLTRFGTAGTLLSALTEATVITAVYAGQNGNASQGSADFVAFYYSA